MELEFNKSHFSYMKCIIREVKHQEETGEIVVPENLPDISSITHAYADIVIRSKECQNGIITISGGIRGGLIYEPEDHSYPRNLDLYLPFTVKVENAAALEQTKIVCTGKIRSADGRIINSRKALLRVNIDCFIAAYNENEDELFDITDTPESLQLKRETYTFTLPVETAEKLFTISDKIQLASSRPPISKIYNVHICAQIHDRKLLSGKGLFKGELQCKLLYLSEDERMYSYEQKIPFSHFCEFNNEYDIENFDLAVALTSVDYEADETSAGGLLTVGILAQGIVWDKRTVMLNTDAYSTAQQFEGEWKQFSIDGQLDFASESHSLNHFLKGKLSELIDSNVFVMYPRVGKKEDTLQISTPVTIQILGLDESGNFVVLQDKTELTQEFDLTEQGRCLTNVEMSADPSTTLLNDGVEVNWSMTSNHRFFSKQKMQTLCAATITPEDRSKRRPSVIIKSVPKQTTLWDVAKEYRSRENAIRLANDLHNETLAEDQVLLIPVG